MNKTIYIILVITLICLNLILCIYIYSINYRATDNPYKILFSRFEEKYISEKKAEYSRYEFSKIANWDKQEFESIFNNPSSKYFALRISSNYCQSCVNNAIIEFIDFCKENDLKSNSVLFAYYSNERDKRYFYNMYKDKVNIIFIENDNLFQDLDEFQKPYYFIYENNSVGFFFAATDDFGRIRLMYFDIIKRYLLSENQK